MHRQCNHGTAPVELVDVQELDVLDAGHQPCALRARGEDVEGRPDGRVSDGVDRRRDAAGERARHVLGQHLGLGHPDAAPPVGWQRTIWFGLDVGQQGGRPRAQGTVGEALLPADLRATVGVAAEWSA